MYNYSGSCGLVSDLCYGLIIESSWEFCFKVKQFLVFPKNGSSLFCGLDDFCLNKLDFETCRL